MRKTASDKCFLLLVFLGLFGFSIGLFDDYRELWMSANNISTTTISHVMSLSYIVTVLVLLMFSIKVTTNKIKNGLTISIIFKMLTSTILICLNNTHNFFLIKFFMFFDIALTELIISSIYPLMLSITKNDELYTKKEAIESISKKLGFLLASILLGKTIIFLKIDYNIFLLFSTIFTFLSFIVLLKVDISPSSNEPTPLELSQCLTYFNTHKVFYYYLFTNFLTGIAWSTVVGMPLLTLTEKLSLSPTLSSFIFLSMGFITSILSILIVKYFKSKNDHINLFFKYGFRLILYLLVFLLNNKAILLITIIGLLITDKTHGFIFNSYFINRIDGKYSLLFVLLKYCTSLLGNSIGVLICGAIFNLDIKYLCVPALIIALIHYVFATHLITKKKSLN